MTINFEAIDVAEAERIHREQASRVSHLLESISFLPDEDSALEHRLSTENLISGIIDPLGIEYLMTRLDEQWLADEEILMKKSRFSEQQIASILKQADDGASADEVCRKAGIPQQTYYRWREKYAGLIPSAIRRLEQLEEENARLKRIIADLSLD